MAVTLNHLTGNRRGFQAKLCADLLFKLRSKMCQRSHGSGYFPDSHVFGRMLEASDIALNLGIPICYFEAEGSWLGMNSVGAANGRRVLKFKSSAFEYGLAGFQIVVDSQR